MTRKDFTLIASVLHSLGADAAHCFDNSMDRVCIAHRFATELRRTNPLFDRVKFIKAAVMTDDTCQSCGQFPCDTHASM